MALYSEKYVSSRAERFINKIWCLDNSENLKAKKDIRLLPNGCFNIGIVTGKGLQVHFERKTYNIKKGIYLCSQVTQRAKVDIEPKTKIIFIQLHAWVFSYFPEYDLSNFVNSIVQLERILPHLEKYFTLDNAEKVLETTELFSEKLNESHKVKSLAEIICRRIQAEDVTVSKLIENTGCSVRSTQIKFKRSTGLTIKQYSKIVNFRESINRIQDSQEQATFTKLALENGYFDQAHYIKTFKKIVKLTPKEFQPKSFLLSYKR